MTIDTEKRISEAIVRLRRNGLTNLDKSRALDKLTYYARRQPRHRTGNSVALTRRCQKRP
jgi:hypothetical protein